MKQAIKLLILWGVGGLLYYGIEILWRGYSHPAMILVGGVCFILCGLINEVFTWDMPLLWQGAAGAVLITYMELASGLILNIKLGLGVWDYSNMPFNFMGQICLPYSLLWVILAAVAVVVDDWLRYFMFREERPRYRLV